MSTSTSSASPPVSTSSVGPTTLGDKRPVLGDYLGNLFGAVDESLAIQTLFEVGTSDIELYAKYDRDQPEMAKGAATFGPPLCANMFVTQPSVLLVGLPPPGNGRDEPSRIVVSLARAIHLSTHLL